MVAKKRTATAVTNARATAKKASALAAKAARAPAAANDKAVPAAQPAGAENQAALAKETAPAKKTPAPAKKTAEPAAGKAEKAAAPAAAHRTAKKTAANKAALAKKTGAKKMAAKKTVAGTAAPVEPAIPTARAAAAPEELAVRPGEEPWTAEEVEKARTGLHDEVLRLRAEIAASQAAVAGLLRDSGDGAGDDQADTGTKNITREHEMSLAANAREMQIQTEHALERLAAGTYGLCESCGNAIGKARMQAFPRATLCVECKQKQERR
jgi:RNA polymerase-binding transcription factor DksA